MQLALCCVFGQAAFIILVISTNGIAECTNDQDVAFQAASGYTTVSAYVHMCWFGKFGRSRFLSAPQHVMQLARHAAVIDMRPVRYAGFIISSWYLVSP